MRLKLVLLGSCVSAVGFAAIGPAEAAPGFYGSVLGGLNWSKDFKGHASTATISSFSTSFFNVNGHSEMGFIVGVAIGYDLSDVVTKGLRVELEGAYRHNHANGSYTFAGTTISSGGTSTTAHTANAVTWSVMANVWYDFDLTDRLKPYVGGGVGWARNKLVPKFTAFPSASNDDFAWQLGAGINYKLSPAASIGLGYRYMDSGEQGSFKSFFGTTVDVGDVTHQDVLFSINFNLN
jgi:opacity protein-like surface antigen